MSNVILLRAPSRDSPDRYESSFKSLGYHVISVPVLETVPTHLDELASIVYIGPFAPQYDGVIITSGRACEGWRKVVRDLLTNLTSEPADWSLTPFYVVGESTGTTLADIRKDFDSLLSPKIIRGGSEAGTSERLAHFILEDLPTKEGTRKLLYLTGDKNRDVLPNILKGGNVQLDTLQVYQTRGSSHFAIDLDVAIETLPPEPKRWWIVFFAPSAAEFVVPILRKRFNLPMRDPIPTDQAPANVNIAAIGPTTSVFLESINLLVDVVATKPTPQDLAGPIKSAENDNNRERLGSNFVAAPP